MKSTKRIAIITGVLYIAGMVAGILSVASSVDAQDYLTQASANANQVMFGAFSQFIMVFAYLGIAITLYPILKEFNERLALGFLSFRIIASAFILVGVIILLLILSVSQESVKAGSPVSSYFLTIGGMLRNGRDLVNHVAMIISLSIGGLMFYLIMYQSRLIPRWLSVWGFIGTISAITASFLVMFRNIEIITPTYILINTPIGLQELVLALWLIFKGFDSNAINMQSENRFKG